MLTIQLVPRRQKKSEKELEKVAKSYLLSKC